MSFWLKLMEKRVSVRNIKGEIKMKKSLLLLFTLGLVFLSACSYHGKQEKDDTYYKRTQSVEWPGTER